MKMLKSLSRLLAAAALACSLQLHAQDTQSISGQVLDAMDNEPVIGANVMVAGTKIAAVTDIDGKFTLNGVPAGKSLKINYIGYVPYEEKISKNKAEYIIRISPDTQNLEEVVVVGYGTQKRSELTGSISSVKGSQIRDFSVNSVADALAGMAPGVSVTKSTGSPGEAPDIIIRGAASVNGMSPLYIVDGVKQGAGFDFNMNDVESIEILKDAGSCAIYGAEAAGGVILVTTKRGQTNQKATVNVTARYGFRKIKSPVKLMNRDQFIEAKTLVGVDILANEGVESASELPDCDWMDVMYDTGNEQEYDINLTGGSEKFNYYTSLGYYREKGCYLDSSIERFTFRSNIDYKASSHVSMGTTVYGNLQKENPTKIYSIYTNCIPFRTVPTMTAVDEDGNWSETPTYINGPNMYANEMSYHYKGRTYGANILGWININFFKGLDFKVVGAGKFGAYSDYIYQEGFNLRSVQENAYFDSESGTSQELTYNATLTYQHDFGKHALKVMIGSEAMKYDAYGTWARAMDFPVDIVKSMQLSTNTDKEATDHIGIGRSESFFGRLNYNFASRYFLTANIRRDGSDRFGKKNRWGTFPSANIAWRFTQEPWLESVRNWLYDGKIRASYGILGNDGIAQFLYQQAMVGTQIIYNYGGTGEVQGWANYKVPNDEIKWEEVHQFDFGVDLALFNNQLTFTYDFYDRRTKDMLYWRVVPLAAGIAYYTDIQNTMPINIGKVSNIGHEFSVNWKQSINGFNYSVGFNASFNKNTVDELGTEGAAPLMSADGINRTENGHAMAMLWGYDCIGIFQTQEQVDEYNAKAQAAGRQYYWKENTGVGDLIFSDINHETGEHQGYVNEDCKTYIGNPWPKMTYGITLTANWKGIDLSALFQGAAGFDIYNAVKNYSQRFADDGNTTMDIYKCSFFGTNGLTDQPRCGFWNEEKGTWITDPSANYSTVSSFWVEKGDYLKLKNLVVGYTLPQKWTRKICMEKFRVYFSAQNLFTITGYSGIDPELAGTSTQNSNKAGTDMKSRGVDTYNRYLPSRLFSFGLDVVF